MLFELLFKPGFEIGARATAVTAATGAGLAAFFPSVPREERHGDGDDQQGERGLPVVHADTLHPNRSIAQRAARLVDHETDEPREARHVGELEERPFPRVGFFFYNSKRTYTLHRKSIK